MNLKKTKMVKILEFISLRSLNVDDQIKRTFAYWHTRVGGVVSPRPPFCVNIVTPYHLLKDFKRVHSTVHSALSVHPSVGRSVCQLVIFHFFCVLWPHCPCPNGLVTSITAPAHPPSSTLCQWQRQLLSILTIELVRRFWSGPSTILHQLFATSILRTSQMAKIMKKRRQNLKMN